MGGFENSLIRCFRRAMAFNRFGADSFLGEELHRRTEEVMKEPPLVLIEGVEQRDHFRII